MWCDEAHRQKRLAPTSFRMGGRYGCAGSRMPMKCCTLIPVLRIRAETSTGTFIRAFRASRSRIIRATFASFRGHVTSTIRKRKNGVTARAMTPFS